VINEALKLANHVIILVGSANLSRSPKNPFTYKERATYINAAFPIENANLNILPLNDDIHNDDGWVAGAQKAVDEFVLPHFNHSNTVFIHGLNDIKIGLIGFPKDRDTENYIKMFPQWDFINVDYQHSVLNATDIRNGFLQSNYIIPTEYHCPKSVIDFMVKFIGKPEFKWLVNFHTYNKTYDPKAWNVNVCCADNVVTQSGHILLVKRKKHPGQGQWALPGGHLNPNEKFIDAAVRELREETGIADRNGKIPASVLKNFITDMRINDEPQRSERARVISVSYRYELPPGELYKVKGDDDAEKAVWRRFAELRPEDFFEDHYFIIRTMVGLS
jgi:bifunctional NMN adenylyltransferase/nudix hydrolase